MLTEAVENAHQILLARFVAARRETDDLFRMIRPEAMYDRPIPERHRIAFYVGHLEAFDWNLFAGDGAAQTEFDRLFAFGIDPVDGNLPSDVPGDWPRLPVIYEYRDQTRGRVDRLLKVDSSQNDENLVLDQKLNVAIEHRLMHAETLAYIFHQMPFERKQGTPTHTAPPNRAIVTGSTVIPAGRAIMGLRRDSGVFGWDNEFDELTAEVPEFAIDRHKITNGQFLKFLNEGGYGDRSLWSPADWEWRASSDISQPVFWIRRGTAWNYRSMFEEIPLPPDEPVYVSHAEASAYARWAGKILPTEAQWHRALDNGSDMRGMLATGWEWTSTVFAPFPGFQPMPFYLGYSEPFFDGKHFVLKGGSPQTAPAMLRPSFRNWFQPHYQYVYAGFRCAEREHTS